MWYNGGMKKNTGGHKMKRQSVSILVLLLLLLLVPATSVVARGPDGEDMGYARPWLRREVTPYEAASPPGYKGTWYVVNGETVKEADLQLLGLPDEVKELSIGIATNVEFYPQGNYWVARNLSWDGFYFAGANDGSGFYCRYYAGYRTCTEGE